MLNLTKAKREGILSECIALSKNRPSKSLVTLNTLMVQESWINKDLDIAIRNADLITADSIGICYAAKILERIKAYRYPGIELMEELLSSGVKSYFFGGKPGIAQSAAEEIKKKYNNSNICGVSHGYQSDFSKIINSVNEMNPDVLFVGLDQPKQEIWINENKEKINAGLIIGIGGSFDVLSGSLKRSPKFFRTAGLEWLWRLLLQPWRIIRIIKLPVFVVQVFGRYLRRKGLLNKS